MAESPDRTESIFAAAVALPNIADRTAFLQRECADDPGLRERIEALLKAHDQAGHLLDRPAAGLLSDGEELGHVRDQTADALAATNADEPTRVVWREDPNLTQN